MLKRGRWWLLGTAVGSVGLGLTFALFVVEPTYRTHATLVFDGLPAIEGLRPADRRDLRTVVDSVKLPTNVREVKRRLGTSMPTPMLAQRIDVEHDGESNVFRVAAKAHSPGAAKELAATTIEVFIESQQQAERERLERHLSDIEKDLQNTRKRLAAARKEYDEFRKEHGITDLPAERQQLITAAAELRASADTAQADAEALQARLGDLGGGTSASAKSSDSRRSSSFSAPAVDRNELSRLRTQLAQARANYTSEHPRVQALAAQLESLKKEARVGGGSDPRYGLTQRKRSDTAAERRAAEKRKTAYESLAQKLRERVKELSAVEGEASSLLATVNVAEGRRGELRELQTKMQDLARSPATGFRVVASAIEPEEPEPSTERKLIAAGVPSISVLLVLAMLLWREFRGLRVRTPSELGYWGKGPVIGTTPWPTDPHALEDLVQELDDCAPEARGNTLVVGATEQERPLASDLARRLSEDWSPTPLVDLDSEAEHMQEAFYPDDTGRANGMDDEGAGSGGEGAQGATSTALSLYRPAGGLQRIAPESMVAQPWRGPTAGPSLRRAARLADRVLVIVTSGEMSAPEIARIRTRLGRSEGVGFLLVGADGKLRELPDRVGPVDDFWSVQR